MILRPYQTDAVSSVHEAWKDHRSTLIVLPTGCHAKGTPILRADGHIVPVESLVVGDILVGPDSSPRYIEHLARGRGRMYRITPVKGDPFVVNEDHILTLVRTGERRNPKYPCQRREGEIVDVSVKEWLGWSKTKKHIHKLFRVPVDFSHEHNEPWYSRCHPSPYLIGVLLGDGGFRCQLTFTTPDDEILDDIVPTLAKEGLKLTPRQQCGEAMMYVLASVRKWKRRPSEFRKWLALLGLNNASCDTKHVPHIYKIASREDRLEILAGLIDTDGSLDGVGYDFISKSPALAHDVAFLARSVGLAAYVKPCEKYCQTGGGGVYYRVGISGDCSIVPCRVSRKQAAPRRQKKDVLRTGFTVECVSDDSPYYGFNLSGDGRFVMGDFTVTHNTGKTIVFSHIAGTARGRVMVIAHREELISQAVKKIKAVTGDEADVEMGEFWASEGVFNRSRVVVSSVQTQNAGGGGNGRMSRFDPSQFDLLIIDEAHHATAPTYRRLIDHYRQNPNLKVLGVTATPDRADEVALGQVFESVAFDYELSDAIAHGWLVPVRQSAVYVEGLDYSSVRTTAGDLNGADLARILEYEETLHGIAHPTMELVGTRKSLVFAASVAHAERLAEIFNRHRPSCARFVCGETPKDERRDTFADYAVGKFQILVNVGVATEGFDDPSIDVVVMARPTKSRSLYAQMAGRGTRTLSDTVDGLESPEERKAAIAASAKPFVEVIDFVGNSGRHKLMTTADILGGKHSDAVVERARKKINEDADGQARDIEDILAEAEEELRREKEREMARRAGLRVQAKYSTNRVNPFDVLQVDPVTARGWDRAKQPSQKQLALLERNGVSTKNLTFTNCSQLIGEIINRQNAGQCTYKQAKILARYGYPATTTFEGASKIIDAVAKNGWRRPKEALV